MSKYSMFHSSSALSHVGTTLRGKFPYTSPSTVEPEPEMWVVLETSSYIPTVVIERTQIQAGVTLEDKGIYIDSNSNFLGDVFVTIVDYLDDSTITSNILDRNDNGEDIIDFMRSNGFPLSNKSYQDSKLVMDMIYKLPQWVYWYGEQLDKYLNNTQVDFGGKMFTQYSADQVLPQYDELFNLDNHKQRRELVKIVPELSYTANSTNNTAYGIGGGLKKHNHTAFLSIGWACKMTKSEFDIWKSYCNIVRLENAIEIPPSKSWTHCSDFAWIYGMGRSIGTIWTHRVAVISGNLLRS